MGQRANYQGTVRDSVYEAARDRRMLELHEQGLTMIVIAQRMNLSAVSVRHRIQRARSAQHADQVDA